MRALTLTLASLVTCTGIGLAQKASPKPPSRLRPTPQLGGVPSGDQELGAGPTAFRGLIPLDGGSWASVHDTMSGGADLGHAVALDALGDIYIAGETRAPGGDWDVLVAKFDRYGNFLWERSHAGSAGTRDYASAIALDGAGNVFVAADSNEVGTGRDLNVLKYDPSGTLLWNQTYDGTGGGYDGFGGGNVLAVDAAGTAFVCGTSFGGATGYDAVTLAYAADGTLLWERRYDGALSSFDDAYSIALDGTGGLYVGADSTVAGTAGVSTDFLVLKYALDGTLLWQAGWDGPDADQDLLYDLAVVGDQGVVVTGTSDGAGTGGDYATVRFDAAGNFLWEQRFDGLGHKNDVPFAVAADAHGNVAVTGTSQTDLASEAVTQLYDANGALLWSSLYVVANEWLGSGTGTNVRFDVKGDLHVIGRSDGGPLTGDDAFALRFGIDGMLHDEVRYDSPTHSTDWISGLATDAHGNIVATGLTIGPGLSLDLLVLKLQ